MSMEKVIQTTLYEVTYSELRQKIQESSLIVGGGYIITDFQTIYKQPRTNEIKAGEIEKLIVVADSEKTISAKVTSYTYPDDVIHYSIDANDCNWNCSNSKGQIVYRKCVKTNNEAPYDFRNIKFARWFLDIDQIPEWDGDYTPTVDDKFEFCAMTIANEVRSAKPYMSEFSTSYSVEEPDFIEHCRSRAETAYQQGLRAVSPQFSCSFTYKEPMEIIDNGSITQYRKAAFILTMTLSYGDKSYIFDIPVVIRNYSSGSYFTTFPFINKVPTYYMVNQIVKVGTFDRVYNPETRQYEDVQTGWDLYIAKDLGYNGTGNQVGMYSKYHITDERAWGKLLTTYIDENTFITTYAQYTDLPHDRRSTRTGGGFVLFDSPDRILGQNQFKYLATHRIDIPTFSEENVIHEEPSGLLSISDKTMCELSTTNNTILPLFGKIYYDNDMIEWVGDGTSHQANQFKGEYQILNNIVCWGSSRNTFDKDCYNITLIFSNDNTLGVACRGILMVESDGNKIGSGNYSSWFIRDYNCTTGHRCGEISFFESTNSSCGNENRRNQFYNALNCSLGHRCQYNSLRQTESSVIKDSSMLNALVRTKNVIIGAESMMNSIANSTTVQLNDSNNSNRIESSSNVQFNGTYNNGNVIVQVNSIRLGSSNCAINIIEGSKCVTIADHCSAVVIRELSSDIKIGTQFVSSTIRNSHVIDIGSRCTDCNLLNVTKMGLGSESSDIIIEESHRVDIGYQSSHVEIYNSTDIKIDRRVSDIIIGAHDTTGPYKMSVGASVVTIGSCCRVINIGNSTMIQIGNSSENITVKNTNRMTTGSRVVRTSVERCEETTIHDNCKDNTLLESDKVVLNENCDGNTIIKSQNIQFGQNACHNTVNTSTSVNIGFETKSSKVYACTVITTGIRSTDINIFKSNRIKVGDNCSFIYFHTSNDIITESNIHKMWFMKSNDVYIESNNTGWDVGELRGDSDRPPRDPQLVLANVLPRWVSKPSLRNNTVMLEELEFPTNQMIHLTRTRVLSDTHPQMDTLDTAITNSNLLNQYTNFRICRYRKLNPDESGSLMYKYCLVCEGDSSWDDNAENRITIATTTSRDVQNAFNQWEDVQVLDPDSSIGDKVFIVTIENGEVLIRPNEVNGIPTYKQRVCYETPIVVSNGHTSENFWNQMPKSPIGFWNGTARVLRNFLRWVDQDGNVITSNTVVTKNLIINAVFAN